MPVYTVEIDGQQVDIEGDRPPNEAEARAALAAHRGGEQPGAVSRFMQPIGQAAHDMAGLPAAAARGIGAMTSATESLAQGDTQPMVDMGSSIVHGIVDPMAKQWHEAANAEDDVSAAGHALAGSIPIIGPAAADAGETMASGNVAGGLGKAAVALAPFAADSVAAKFRLTSRAADVLNGQADSRMIKNVLRPRTEAQAVVAKDIAPDLVRGVPGRTEGGLGAGNLDTLVTRAKARTKIAKGELRGLQAGTTPVSTDRIEQGLRGEAMSHEQIAPSGQIFTERPALVDALDAQASKVKEITAAHGGNATVPVSAGAVPHGHVRLYRGQELGGGGGTWFTTDPDLAKFYGDVHYVDVPESVSKAAIPSHEPYPSLTDKRQLSPEWAGKAQPLNTTRAGGVPSGTLFQQRADLNAEFGGKRKVLPGESSPAQVEAGNTRAALTSDTLHDTIAGSAQTDRLYRVSRQASIMLERSGLREMVGGRWDGVKNLLASRIAGMSLGAAAGVGAHGVSGGIIGALGGLALSEWKFWGSLRAQEYARVAGFLKAGDVDGAAGTILKAANAYAIANVARTRKASDALRDQANGSPTP